MKALFKRVSVCILTVGFSFPALAATVHAVLPKLNLLDVMEMEAGQLGVAKSCRADVKAYAQKLATDHANHHALVAQLAEAEGLSLREVKLNQWEASNVQKQQEAMAVLKGLSDCSFDEAFLTAMKEAHVFAIHLVSFALAHEKHEQMVTFLHQTLISLNGHYQLSVRLLAVAE